MSLFFSFEGQIGRGKFWLGTLALAAVGIAISFALMPLLTGTPGLARWISPILTLLLAYPAAAIITKRLHDRGKPMTPWLWIFMIPGIVSNLMQAIGVGFEEVQIDGVTA